MNEKHYWLIHAGENNKHVADFYAETHTKERPSEDTLLRAASYYGYGPRMVSLSEPVLCVGQPPPIDANPFKSGDIKIWRILSPGEDNPH